MRQNQKIDSSSGQFVPSVRWKILVCGKLKYKSMLLMYSSVSIQGRTKPVFQKKLYTSRFQRDKLNTDHQKLYGPDDKPITTLGFFTAQLRNKFYEIDERIFVISGSTALLSRRASVRLGLVKFLGEVSNNSTSVTTKIVNQHQDLFKGLGKLETEYDIKLAPNVTPYSVYSPRRIPLPMMSKVKAELERLQDLGVITPVEDPTPWCAPIVVVPKLTGSVRVCVDLTHLNKAVLRERHILPSVDHTLGQMAGAKVFSKIDANSGFHQIPLSDRSKLLTTFITPYGRFAYNRLPFGISSGPELFQRIMSRLLENLDGVVCLMDDVVVYGCDQAEHDLRLQQALHKLAQTGITLNKEKCTFGKTSIEFLGQIISADGIKASHEKIQAIELLETPTDIHKLRRFMGMINQLGKFVPHLADLTSPIRSLLSKKVDWLWGPHQDLAFNKIKRALTSSPVLALYDANINTKISADSSSYGLGAVLLQEHSNDWKPVAYASRTLSPTEGRYAQIEKEALAVTWACEKFEN